MARRAGRNSGRHHRAEAAVPVDREVHGQGRVGWLEGDRQGGRAALIDRRRHTGLQAFGEAHIVQKEQVADQPVQAAALEHVGADVAVADLHRGRGELQGLDLDRRHLALEAVGHLEAVVVAVEKAQLQRLRRQRHIGQPRVKRRGMEDHLDLGLLGQDRRRKDVEGQQRLVGRHQQAVVHHRVEVDDVVGGLLQQLRGLAREDRALARDQALDDLAPAHHQRVVRLRRGQLVLHDLLQGRLEVILQGRNAERVDRLAGGVDLDLVFEFEVSQPLADHLVDRAIDKVPDRVGGLGLLLVVGVGQPILVVPGGVARAAADGGGRRDTELVALDLAGQRVHQAIEDLVEDGADGLVEECACALVEDGGRIGLEHEQAADVELAHIGHVDVETLAALERPTGQFVREREAALVVAAEAPVQRLLDAVLEVAVEHRRHRFGTLGDFGVVVGRVKRVQRHRRCRRCGQ